MAGIGVLNEKPLHASLKDFCARPGDQFEVTVDGFVIDIVRGDGTIALTGRSEGTFNLDPQFLIGRELSIFGTIRGDFDMAIMMLQKGRIEVKRMVSKEFTLEQGAQAFEAALKPEVVKVNINI